MSQRVLITAGAGGIGLAIARAYASRGARVHVADIDAGAVERLRGELPSVSTTVGDIAADGDLELPGRPPRWPTTQSRTGRRSSS